MEAVHTGRHHGTNILIRQKSHQKLKTCVNQGGVNFILGQPVDFRGDHESNGFILASPDGINPSKLRAQMNLTVSKTLIIDGTVDFLRAALFQHFDIHGSGRIMCLG